MKYGIFQAADGKQGEDWWQKLAGEQGKYITLTSSKLLERIRFPFQECPKKHCFTLQKKHALGWLVTDSQHQELGAFFNAKMMLYHYMCSQGTAAWGKQENISPLRAGRFSNWDKRRVVLGESQAEWIAGQGRSFSPLMSLQNPIGKAELHHWEINILILRTAVTETVQDTGSGHWDLAHIPYILLCLSQKH